MKSSLVKLVKTCQEVTKAKSKLGSTASCLLATSCSTSIRVTYIMLSAIRAARSGSARRVRSTIYQLDGNSCICAQAFSSSASRLHDVSKLTLIGRLGRDPEVKSTKNGKEYIQYVVYSTIWNVKIDIYMTDMLSPPPTTHPLLLTLTAVRVVVTQLRST